MCFCGGDTQSVGCVGVRGPVGPLGQSLCQGDGWVLGCAFGSVSSFALIVSILTMSLTIPRHVFVGRNICNIQNDASSTYCRNDGLLWTPFWSFCESRRRQTRGLRRRRLRRVYRAIAPFFRIKGYHCPQRRGSPQRIGPAPRAWVLKAMTEFCVPRTAHFRAKGGLCPDPTTEHRVVEPFATSFYTAAMQRACCVLDEAGRPLQHGVWEATSKRGARELKERLAWLTPGLGKRQT